MTDVLIMRLIRLASPPVTGQRADGRSQVALDLCSGERRFDRGPRSRPELGTDRSGLLDEHDPCAGGEGVTTVLRDAVA